jgi:hypothetical protein
MWVAVSARGVYNGRFTSNKQHEQEDDVWPDELKPRLASPLLLVLQGVPWSDKSSNHPYTLIASLHPTLQGTDHADAPAHGACMCAID